MMEAKRDRRIRDKLRQKAKASRIGERYGGNWSKLYDHLAYCSGPCCGNPRKWFGELTMQERRAFIAEMVG